jgi:hypothetical protein
MDRTPQPDAGEEIPLLLGWLNFHRDALAAKCDGLRTDQLALASSPTSTLSLLGLLRHLTEMERHYLVHALSGVNRGSHYCTDENPEADIEHVGAGMVEDSMRRWLQERCTMTARDAVRACRLPRPHTVVPVHYEGGHTSSRPDRRSRRSWLGRPRWAAASPGFRSARRPYSPPERAVALHVRTR